MRLVSPTGVEFSVSDEKGERLKREGCREPEAAKPAPGPAPSPDKRTRRKPSKEPEDGASTAG